MKRRVLSGAVVATVAIGLLAGCVPPRSVASPVAAPSGATPTSPAPPTSAAPTPAAPTTAPATQVTTTSAAPAPYNGQVAIPATAGTFTVPFDLTAHGSTTGGDVSVDLSHDSGQVNYFGSALTALAYYHQPWTDFDLVIYQVLAIDAKNLYVIWVYCSHDAITYLYYETTDGAGIRSDSASGSCAVTTAATHVHASSPAAHIAAKVATRTASISGDGLKLGPSGVGSIDINGRSAQLVVFSIVDCRTTCGTQQWVELHSLIVEPQGRVTIGIIYLEYSDRHHAKLAYTISLPDLRMTESVLYPATWSV
jgi:hypothetical protein